MNLLDHFHPPLSTQRHWEGFYSKWASAIVDQLNEQLPPRYFAEPHVHRGGQFEIDVATFEEAATGTTEQSTATMVWSPARPTTSIPLPASTFDAFEVRVINDEAGPRLVAAIELVSPSNKDRPESRNAFAVRCAAYLQQSISIIVIDVVTSRSADLHGELLEILKASSERDGNTSSLYAAAYRTKQASDDAVDVWWEDLAIDRPLPTLPLWLNSVEAVPVDLGECYGVTCHTLRIDEIT